MLCAGLPALPRAGTKPANEQRAPSRTARATERRDVRGTLPPAECRRKELPRRGRVQHMKAVLQRVSAAQVDIDGETVGRIGRGFLVLLGIAQGDTEEDMERLLAKILRLRVFEDENGRMNRSVQDVGGGLLVVSQFTLLANYRHGNRPDFLGAAAPAEAEPLYRLFLERAAQTVPVQHGRFGADMQVSLCNDGPVTIVMDSEVLKPGAGTAKETPN